VLYRSEPEVGPFEREMIAGNYKRNLEENQKAKLRTEDSRGKSDRFNVTDTCDDR
jgi:hypothetical protein